MEKTFEDKLARLEQIVGALEKGDAQLAESLKLFEEGTKLVGECGKMLDEAEQKVVKLAKGAIRFGNAVWVGTECALSEGYDLNAIVPRCVNAMLYYRDTFYRAYSQTPSGQVEMKKAQENQPAPEA